MADKKVWFITGAGRGMGVDIAKAAFVAGYAGFFEEISPEDFRAQVETTLFGPMNVTRAVLPVMRAQRSGLVVPISSTAGITGGEFCTAYAASINVQGLPYTTRAALPHLLQAAEDGPRRVADIVNISSIAGRVAWNGYGVYNFTKFGVNGFTESLRVERRTNARTCRDPLVPMSGINRRLRMLGAGTPARPRGLLRRCVLRHVQIFAEAVFPPFRSAAS